MGTSRYHVLLASPCVCTTSYLPATKSCMTRALLADLLRMFSSCVGTRAHHVVCTGVREQAAVGKRSCRCFTFVCSVVFLFHSWTLSSSIIHHALVQVSSPSASIKFLFKTLKLTLQMKCPPQYWCLFQPGIFSFPSSHSTHSEHG